MTWNFSLEKEEKVDKGRDFSFEEIDKEIENTMTRSQKILNNTEYTSVKKKEELEFQLVYLYNMVYKKMKPFVFKKKEEVESAIKLLQEEIKNLDTIKVEQNTLNEFEELSEKRHKALVEFEKSIENISEEDAWEKLKEIDKEWDIFAARSQSDSEYHSGQNLINAKIKEIFYLFPNLEKRHEEYGG